MFKNLIIFLLLCIVLIFIGNRLYAFNKEPEITGSFSIQTSASPNKMNIIEIQEMYKEDNVGLHASGGPMFHSLRIYYGEYGSLLEKYVVLEDIRMSYIDYFEVVWTDDEHVIINVMPRNAAGENIVVDSYEFDFTTQTLVQQAN